MKNFSKSILNYFATYNETRFRFNTRVAQKWTNNELTLDVAIFPEFQRNIVTQLNSNKTFNLSVKKDQYQIRLDLNDFKQEIKKICKQLCTIKVLKSIQAELLEQLPENTEPDSAEIYRQHALKIRKRVGDALLELQDIKKQQLLAELNLDRLPTSTLNQVSIEQEVFDALTKLNSDNFEQYLDQAEEFLLQNFAPELIIYDLYLLLSTFYRFISTQTLYIYLHEFIFKEESYPLLSVEVDLKPNRDAFVLNLSRDIVYINTPAINSAKIGSVLTTPRACKLEDLDTYVLQMEMYLNSYYKNTESFILKDFFSKKVGANLPTIQPRIGLQIVSKENRKILDYSELITQIDSGAGQKFSDLVQTYVESNVENTTNEVNQTFKAEYPKKSYKNLITDIPLNLNQNQKRVLMAAKNKRNKLMVIDGPPGTGKSYTITALIYFANLLNKKILITSHKKQALDVVESKLIDQFRKVHPHAKPPILRLTKNGEESLDSIENTLSSAVINATNNRQFDFDEELVVKDKKRTEESVKTINDKFWKTGLSYSDKLTKLQQLLELHQKLIPESEIPIKTIIADLDWHQFDSIVKHIVDSRIQNVSFDQLLNLGNHQRDIDKWILNCEKLHELNIKPINNNHTYPTDIDFNTLNLKMKPFFKAFKDSAKIGSILLDNIKLIDKTDYATNLSWDEFKKALDLLENIDKNNSGLNRFIGSRTKRELEYSLELNYPTIFKIYKQRGLEKTLFKLCAESKRIDNFADKYPFFKKEFLYSQPVSLDEIRQAQKLITNIEYESVFKLISKLEEVEPSKLTIAKLKSTLNNLVNQTKLTQIYQIIDYPLQILQLDKTQINKLHSILKTYSDLIKKVDVQSLKKVADIFNLYQDLWSIVNFNYADVSSLELIYQNNDVFEQIKQYIEFHRDLSNEQILDFDFSKIDQYSEKVQRILEYKNQKRFAGLLNHGADVQRILNHIETGKRLSEEETEVLFKYIPCIIAPTDLISKYFPMEADIIDWLIIDEASQVSIAESLSLILRAKQTIVFGDELQYGAVGAINVSKDYSKQYFRDVIDKYVEDKNDYISEEIKEKIASEVSENISEDEVVVSSVSQYKVTDATKEWLKTFSIRTSTLDFAKALANYKDSLDVHFRSYPEIISYSNKVFYKPSEINLITSRIRTKPITEVLQFIKVKTKGLAGERINLDEIEVIKKELQRLYDNNYTGSIGIICSFQEQTSRIKEELRKNLSCYVQLKENNKLTIWFVGEVQGEERDIVFYSFVEDKSIGNAQLRYIYPAVGQKADNIRNLKKQRLNVGFSRAKDKMVFVHSMDLNEYKDTVLGDALEHYQNLLLDTKDHYIKDESVFDSPAEKELYNLIIQTDFYQTYKDSLNLIAQFEMGKYLKEEYRKYVPNFRVDFLLTYVNQGKEHPLIIEYDGLEYHTKNPYEVNDATSFEQEYLEYDVQRQLEIESYGYKFLRINKFTLIPTQKNQTKIDVLNNLLYKKFGQHLVTVNKKTQTPVINTVNDDASLNDNYDSIQEKKLEEKIRNTQFFKTNQDKLTLISQYQVGEYIREKYNAKIALYKTDFLLIYHKNNQDIKLIIEYDGEDYHDSEYDHQRDAQISQFGFKFLRINKNTLKDDNKDEVTKLNDLLISSLEA